MSKQRSFPFGEYLLPNYKHATPQAIAVVGEHLVYTVGEELKHLVEADIFKKTDIVGVRLAPNWNFIDEDGRRRTAKGWMGKADNYAEAMDAAVKAASDAHKVLILGGPCEQSLPTVDDIMAYGEFEATRTQLVRERYGQHAMTGVGSVSFGTIKPEWWVPFWNDGLDALAKAGAVVFQENMYDHWWELLLVGPWQAPMAWPKGMPVKDWPGAESLGEFDRENPIEAHLAGRIYWWLKDLLPEYVPVIHPEIGPEYIDPRQAQKYGVPIRDDGGPYEGINSLRHGLEKHAGASDGVATIVNRFKSLAALMAHYPQDYGGAWFATGDGAKEKGAKEGDWAGYNTQRAKADVLYRELIQSYPLVERVEIQNWAAHVLAQEIPEEPPEEPPVIVDPPTPAPQNGAYWKALLSVIEAREASLRLQADALKMEAQAIREFLEAVKEKESES